ncbi:MAG: adenosylcobinamide-GDP ribazoletransferase [Alphaproteobacteria bacterium]|nr:adenosylcobinamide-GDP ribazoletransferase [Alphaproteobacteria bacterium]
MADWRRDLGTAAAFLTRLPIAAEPRPLSPAMRAFPLVGAAIGLGGGVLYALLLAWGLPPLVAATVTLGAVVLVTGALHEDGLADAADGLGGGDPARRLALMRDSRIGAFGVIALTLSLLARVAAVAALGGGEAIAAWVAAAALSRAVFPLMMITTRPARSDGAGAGAGRPTEGVLATAGALAYLLAALAVGPWDALLLLLAAAAAAGLVAVAAHRRIGGYTGDVLGAGQQAAEVAVLALAAALAQGAAA